MGKGVAMLEGNREPNSPIRVLLADDHTLFRQGLAGLLGAYGGLEIIAQVPNDEEALSKSRLGREARRGHHAGTDALRKV